MPFSWAYCLLPLPVRRIRGTDLRSVRCTKLHLCASERLDFGDCSCGQIRRASGRSRPLVIPSTRPQGPNHRNTTPF